MFHANNKHHYFRLSLDLTLALVAFISAVTLTLHSQIVAQTQTIGGSWSNTGNLKAGRDSHTATLLPNGKVLVVVYRIYKSAYGNLAGAPVPVRLNEFLPDAQQIGQGIVVGVGNGQAQLEANKQTFVADFVSRPRFSTDYPFSMTPAKFVDTTLLTAGLSPPMSERASIINEFGSTATSEDEAARERVLRRVAENSTLKQQEFNRAYVLMQYFGYLRRNPNDPPEPTLDFAGYNFWLNKLNQFNSNFAEAEMVKAFINSTEYRQRFGPL